MTETKKTPAHIICIKWGTLYDAEDVNTLYAMVKRNTHHHDICFHCFTDRSEGLHPDIIIHDLPQLDVDNIEDIIPIYNKEVALCDDNLGGLRGERVLFFDLDVIITDEIDSMISYPQDDQFVIINDWNTKGDHVGQATCYSWRIGSLGFVKTDFETDPYAVMKAFGTASQHYLSSKVIEKWGSLNFWPESWCKSFKKHALPKWPERLWKQAELPEGTKILAFHGNPKIQAAIDGVWSKDPMPVHKYIYKTIRPNPWIENYWTKHPNP